MGVAAAPCRPALGQDRPTLSGTWSASAMTVQYAIGDWGDKCGPRPSGGGAGAGTVTIVQSGSELQINGAGGSYSTTNCFEQGPGLRRVSHSASARGWSNRCTTAANDPRQSVVITTMSATDNSISFSETGTYQFVLEGQNCTASVRRTRSFSLIRRDGESAPPKASETVAPPASAAPTVTSTAKPPQQTITKEKEPPPPPPSCNEVGEPARVEVRPARKLMRPGEDFTFQTRVVDAKGCRVDTHPTWSVTTQGSKVTVDAAGKVSVPADAPEGTNEILISVSGQNVRVTVEIASVERYDALLSARGLNAKGEAEEAAVVTIATGSLGGASAVSEDGAKRRKIIFVSVVGGLATALAVAGVVLLRRGQKKRAALEAQQREQDEQEEAEARREAEEDFRRRREREQKRAAAAAAAAAAAPASAGPRMHCPVCRREFMNAGTYCPADGTRLVALATAAQPGGPAGKVCPVCGRGFEPSVQVCPQHRELLVAAAVYQATAQKPAAAEPRGKICPTCGARYSGDSVFCGKDGTSLVLVN